GRGAGDGRRAGAGTRRCPGGRHGTRRPRGARVRRGRRLMVEGATSPAKVVVKVGSSSITTERGELDDAAVLKLCGELAAAHHAGHEVVLVCSGAIAAGLPALAMPGRPTDIGTLQAVAAVGQPKLMERIGGSPAPARAPGR